MDHPFKLADQLTCAALYSENSEPFEINYSTFFLHKVQRRSRWLTKRSNRVAASAHPASAELRRDLVPALEG